MKIDCHLHLPVREGLSNLNERKALLLETLKTENIDYGIVIPDNLQESLIGNLQECLELFKNEPSIFIAASANIVTEHQSSVNELDSLFHQRRIVGLKIFPGHDEHFPNDQRLTPLIELCLKHNAPFMIHTGWNSGNPDAAKWNDPKYIVELVDKYSELKIVICHYFWPELEYCYQITRGKANIHFDTSGLADKEVEDATGVKTIKDVLERTITDNPKSVLLGSDFGGCDIASHIKLIDSLDVSQETKEMAYYQNVIDLFPLRIHK